MYTPIVLGDLDSAAMRPIGQGHPDRVNHHTPDPAAHGVRDDCAQESARAESPATVAGEAGGTMRTWSMAIWRVSTRMPSPEETTSPRCCGARLMACSV